MELTFHSGLRQSAVGLSSLAFRFASLLSPVFGMLAAYHWSIPISTFSSLVVISGALVFLLPETTRKELPDSTDEAEGSVIYRQLKLVKGCLDDVNVFSLICRNVTTKKTGIYHNRIKSTKL